MGLIVGCLIGISTTVLAEGTLVGKVIDGIMPLYIDGQRAEKDLIIVDGTSYAPMRAAAGLFGYDINYIPETKEIAMKKDIFKEIKPIKIKNELKPNLMDTDYMIYENEMLLPAASIGGEVAKWDGTTLTLTVNGKTATGTRESRLENGDPMQRMLNGIMYVKLSALGLKGTLQNGELTIE